MSGQNEGGEGEGGGDGGRMARLFGAATGFAGGGNQIKDDEGDIAYAQATEFRFLMRHDDQIMLYAKDRKYKFL